MEELVGKFEKWKTGLEDKGLRVNAAKTKVMISSSKARSGIEVGRWPCGVCRKGVVVIPYFVRVVSIGSTGNVVVFQED